MHITRAVLLLGGSLALAVPARAQESGAGPRWLAYAGCWQAAETSAVAPGPVLCVVPTGENAADIVAVDSGRVVARTAVVATGERTPTAPGGGCAGWQRAHFSPDGVRLYRSGGFSCSFGATGTTSELLAFLPNGEWIDVQAAAAGGPGAVRVLRYRPARPSDVPDSLAAALGALEAPARAARAEAGAPVLPGDIIEASHQADASIVSAWLANSWLGFRANARTLVRLADAGVPGEVVDVAVALSYPSVFTVNPETGRGEALAGAPGGRGDLASGVRPAPLYPEHGFDSYGNPIGYFDYYSPFGYGYRYAYGYGYPGYGAYYTTQPPVVIVVNGSSAGTAAPPHGRVVNNRGYSEGSRPSTGATPPAPRPSGGTAAPSGGSPPSSGSSGSNEGRTAKPRP